MVLVAGNQQERVVVEIVEVRVGGVRNLPHSGNLSAIVDVDSEPQLNSGRNQAVQVDHVAVLPQKTVYRQATIPRSAYNLAF
jgi:hypothetical protein